MKNQKSTRLTQGCVKSDVEHIYESIEGWFNFEDLYSQVASKTQNGWKLVEIGCWQGRSAAFLATELANSGKTFDFYCVDTWDGSEEHLNENSHAYSPLIQQKDWLYNKFLTNMEPLKDYFTPIRKESIEAAKDFVLRLAKEKAATVVAEAAAAAAARAKPLQRLSLVVYGKT